MARCLGHRLLPVEIVLVFGRFGLFARGHGAVKDAPGSKEAAKGGPGLGVFADPFGHDVPGPGQGVVGVFHTLFRVDEIGGSLFRIHAVLGKERLGQRLEPFFPGDGGLGAAFGPVGQVDVFQHAQGFGVLNLIAQFVGEMAVLFQGLEDGLLSGVQVGQLLKAVANSGHGDFIQAAGGLLAVAGDERDGGTVIEQGGHGGHLGGGHAGFVGNEVVVGLGHLLLESMG